MKEEVEGEKMCPQDRDQKLRSREGLTTPSSALNSNSKMNGNGRPNPIKNRRGSFSSYQSRAKGNQTAASSRIRRDSLPRHQSSSSNSMVWQVKSPSSSQGSISPHVVKSQEIQTLPCGNNDVDQEIGPGSEPEDETSNKIKDANLEVQSPSNKVLPSSPSSNQRSTSPQVVERQQTQTSPQRPMNVDWEGGPGSEVVEGPFDICSSNSDVKSNKTVQGIKQTSSQRSEPEEGPFDICGAVNSAVVKLNKPLHLLNKERKKEAERARSASLTRYLRSGMVLLKDFISYTDQVKIVKKCRDLGVGCGGFYRPGYRDGAKLHLRMMCLGKDWDPQLRLYGKSRLFDDAVPPEIPLEFKNLVDEALHSARNFLKQSTKSMEEIPKMSPDICIVNFYSNSGNLGLHQDRDEGETSLKKGLPVVSFSIGDTAEFLYSDERDGKTEKVMLESGDVLIFGGKSRHIFHGVSSIKSKTAPTLLIDETKLLPGRLNLTFRQY